MCLERQTILLCYSLLGKDQYQGWHGVKWISTATIFYSVSSLESLSLTLKKTGCQFDSTPVVFSIFLFFLKPWLFVTINIITSNIFLEVSFKFIISFRGYEDFFHQHLQFSLFFWTFWHLLVAKNKHMV